MSNQSAIIRPSQLPSLLGLSSATIHRLRVAGKFVKPIELGAQSIGFRRIEIEEWLSNRPVRAHFIESL